MGTEVRERMTRPGLDPAARGVVHTWLGAVGARLPGPTSARQALLTELLDGLLEAVDAHQASGLEPALAARAAVAEFGDPRTVARSLAPELAAVQARRTAVALIPSGPLVGLLWVLALAASHLSGPLPPWRPGMLAGPWVALPLLGPALVIGVPAALLAMAATGRPSRWLPDRPRLAPTAAATAGIAGIAVDLTLLGMLTAQVVVAPGQLAWAPITAAALASLVRLTFAGRAAHRCLATRAALA